MIEIRKIVTKPGVKDYTNFYITFAHPQAVAYKKHSLRGQLDVKVLDSKHFGLELKLVDSNSNSAYQQDSAFVRPAYLGREDELEVNFATQKRFGLNLPAGVYDAQDVTVEGSTLHWTIVADTGAAPVSATPQGNIADELIAAVYDDTTTKEQMREMLDAAIERKYSKPVVAKAPASKTKVKESPANKARRRVRAGRQAITPDKVKLIHQYRKTMTLMATAAKVGVSLSTVSRYDKKK